MKAISMKKLNVVMVIIMILCVMASCIACSVEASIEASAEAKSESSNLSVEPESAPRVEGISYDVEAKNLTDAEDAVVKYFFKLRSGKDEDFDSLWEDCVSSITKDMGYFTKDSVVDGLKKKMESGYSLESFTITDSRSLGDGLYTVTAKYREKVSGEEREQESTFMVKDDGESFKVVYRNLLAYEKGKAMGDTKLEIKKVEVFKYFNRCILDMELSNPTNGAYSVGSNEKPAQITYISEGGATSVELEEPIIVAAGETVRVQITVKGKNFSPAFGIAIGNIVETQKDKEGKDITKVLTGRYLIQK